jgi:Zn-dependent peptidase ImmA (M78 family)
MRRGFKKEANSLARDVRKELGLELVAPLDPWKLAQYLEIPVWRLKDFRAEAPTAYRHFAQIKSSEFSAVTVFLGCQRVIVHNDAHSMGRQSSNLAHELSHALLLHPPAPALDSNGCRDWDKEREDEANWLAGTMLISEEAALKIARIGWSEREAATEYGVSDQMIRFRLNMTAARTRVYLSRRKVISHTDQTFPSFHRQ